MPSALQVNRKLNKPDISLSRCPLVLWFAAFLRLYVNVSEGSNFVFRRVRKIAKSECLLRHVCPSLRLSAWKYPALTGRIFMKFDI